MVEVSQVYHPHLVLAPAPPSLITCSRQQPANIVPMLQSLVPQPPQPQPPSLHAPPGVLVLIKKEEPVEDAPLDLSCKSSNNKKLEVVAPPANVLPTFPPSEPFAIYRTNSVSSSSSSSSRVSHPSGGSSSGGSGGEILEERRLKRKEQNKAAALSYRQRKKSFSEQIETEHEKLTKRNVQLKTQKQKLEEQIGRMRKLLNEVAAEGKKEEVPESASSANSYRDDDTMSEPSCQDLPRVDVCLQQPPQAPMPIVQHSLPPPNPDNQAEMVKRTRKYTWPLTLTGKDRKKEQNKLASRRFRQRRKQEQSHCEIEAHQLEENNRRMRERCDELESKIKLLKDLMQRNAMQTGGAFPIQ